MALVIRFNCPFDGPTHYFINFNNIITHYNFAGYMSLAENENFVVEKYLEVVFPDWNVVPFCMANLSKLTCGTDGCSATMDSIHDFNLAWELACQMNKKEVPMSVPCKALMLFNADENMNSYDHDVFLYTSTDGIRRMTFTEYLHLIEGKHDAQYKLCKLSMGRLSGLPLADFKWFKGHVTAQQTKYRDAKVLMVFRELWYAATGEEMPI